MDLRSRILNQARQRANPVSNGMYNQNPGQKIGLSVADNQKLNRDDFWKVHGYTFQITSGATEKFPITISGEAWCTFGLALKCVQGAAPSDATAPVSVSLMVNQELVIEEMPWSLMDVRYMTHMYWPFERLLSGSDSISLIVENSANNNTIAAAFYYL